MQTKYIAIGHITVDEIRGKGSTELRLGGGVSYGALFAVGLGYSAEILSKVGTDFPREFVEFLRQAGVGLDHLHVVDGETTRFVIELERESIVSSLAARCDPVGIEDLNDLRGDIIHLGPVCSEIEHEVVLEALDRGNVVVLDLQGILRDFDEDGNLILRSDKLETLRGLDLVVHANKLESLAATGEEDVLRAAERLSDMFWIASITLGEEGAIISSPEGLIKATPPRVEVVDDVGAGDVFAAALGIALQRGDSLEDIARFSVASATASVMARGPQIIPKKRIEEILRDVRISWL